MRLGYNDVNAIGLVMSGLSDMVKASQAPAPKETVVGRQAVKKEFHSEETVAGLELESYLRREPGEDDKFVKVIYHDEWVEKVPVPLPPPPPPTPEQIIAREQRATLKLKVKAILTGIGIVTAGVVTGYAVREHNIHKGISNQLKYSTPKSIADFAPKEN